MPRLVAFPSPDKRNAQRKSCLALHREYVTLVKRDRL